MSLMQRGGGDLHSRLQEDAHPTRPSMQTAWDKGEHGNLDPAATEGGVRPQWRTTTCTVRAHDAACDKGGIGLHFLPALGQMDFPRSQKAGWGMDRQQDRTTAQCRREGGVRTISTTACQENPVGRSAGKLVRIVDRYLPDLANETRCYMIRYPHEVKNLLKQAMTTSPGQ